TTRGETLADVGGRRRGSLAGRAGVPRGGAIVNRRQSDFARVYDDHLWRVYGFLAYRLADRDSAEDLTQATFERALRAWSRFDPRRGSERTWLPAIAHNVIVD